MALPLSNKPLTPSPASSNPDHLSNLNPEQLQAVKHKDGPLLVFAGAGSGKTRVLTRRIAHLVLEHKVHPSRILAVTFTNKAAGEMKERVNGLLGFSSRMWVSTFHSMCVRILREHAEHLGFTKQFGIYDSQDSLSVMKRIYKTIGVDPKVIEPKAVLGRIDRAKNEYKDSEAIRSETHFPSDVTALVADLYEAYQEELLKCNAMDFGDLICNVLSLLKLDSVIRERYQEQFQYILVDEYQDTNQVQYLLLEQLAKKHQNICAVGDDDQSIYAFRGASIDKILNFNKNYPEAGVITLDTNYRSSQNILEAANQVIAQNEKRRVKKMKTNNQPGELLSCFKAYTEINEAEFIVSEILKLKSAGAKLSDIAIFYRTNAQSRALEETLLETGLPYEIYGGHKFYDRKEIKDILAYFKLSLNPRDNESFSRIVNNPARGLGQSSLAKLQVFASANGLNLLEACKKAGEGEVPGLSAQASKKFLKFFELIEGFSLGAKEAEQVSQNSDNSEADRVGSLASLLEKIAGESGYLKKLHQANTDEANSRVENINELFAASTDYLKRQFEVLGEYPPLETFLDRACLASDLDKSEGKDTSGILSLMTLHLAKGLEFETVFICGLEEGLLPHVRSLEDSSALEEERRLCYVGITRAKSRLYLSRVTDRQSYGYNSWYAGLPSRFISDIPSELADDVEGRGFFEHY